MRGSILYVQIVVTMATFLEIVEVLERSPLLCYLSMGV